ncbi:SsrA-binding protein SmpB [Candidatus Nomurabacteria bacterium]|nr:SsrA-binding protein SmpB [Candidatus Nomurabacteria bacterium]MCB9820845.1 SsrA-binding protein SmpB [Candidatus Nomurabacteria bacterium]
MQLAVNKTAHLDYEILDKYECGIELLGTEVKSIKLKTAKISGGRVLIRGDEAFLVGLYVPPFQDKNAPEDYDPARTRKLLLHKKEIKKLETKLNDKGLTIVPLALYNKGRRVKVEIALVRGKKKFDKREDLKKKETQRRIRKQYNVR